MVERVFKFGSGTNYGLFMEHIDLRMLGNDVHGDVDTWEVRLTNPSERVIDYALDLGAEEEY